MSTYARKELVRSIKKGLLSLSADQIFEIATVVSASRQGEPAKWDNRDEDECFEYVCSHMSSTFLLDLEDEGMCVLLGLKDLIDDMIKRPSTSLETAEGRPRSVTDSHPSLATTQNFNTQVNAKTLPYDHEADQVAGPEMHVSDGHGALPHSPTHACSNLHPSVHTPTTQSVYLAAEQLPAHRGDSLVTLRDLALLNRREFKIHGGYVGDSSADISYSNICKQIDEGIKEQHTEREIIRAVMRVIQPGHFKNMLTCKDEMTVTELKSFLQSHIGEKGTAELFQELVLAKQSESESPQQFIYRMVGLKQKVIFTSKQSDADIRYETHTVQNVFLRSIRQGLSDKNEDIRRELKPLLSDPSVTDEALLRQVNKITSEESERRQRLGRSKPTKAVYAQSGEVSLEKSRDWKGDPHHKRDEEMQKLTTQVQALTQLVESLKGSKQQPDVQAQNPQQPACHCANVNTKSSPTKRFKPRGCPACIEQKLPNCQHCFACGGEGHRAVGCLKRRKPAGNQPWSQTRDGL